MKKLLGIISIIFIAVIFYRYKSSSNIEYINTHSPKNPPRKFLSGLQEISHPAPLKINDLGPSLLKLEDKCHRQLKYSSDELNDGKLIYENFHIEMNNGEVYRLRHFFEKEEKMTLLLENKEQFPILTKWPDEIKNKSFNEKLNYFINHGKIIYKEIGRSFTKPKIYIEEKNDEIIFIQSDDPNNLFECRLD